MNFECPDRRIQNVVDVGLAGRQAASPNLKQPVDIGILQEQIVGRKVLPQPPPADTPDSQNTSDSAILNRIISETTHEAHGLVLEIRPGV